MVKNHYIPPQGASQPLWEQVVRSPATRVRMKDGSNQALAKILASRASVMAQLLKTLDHPGIVVRTAAKDCEMPSVGRGDAAERSGILLLPQDVRVSVKVHI